MTNRNQDILAEQLKAQGDFFDPNDETIPSRGYTDGSLNQDGKAMAAIKALPPGMVSSVLYEQEFAIERLLPFDSPRWIMEMLEGWRDSKEPVLLGLGSRRAPVEPVIAHVSEYLNDITLALNAMRLEVETLARAYQKELANQRAFESQKDQAEQFQLLFGLHKELRTFLYRNFGAELEQAEAQKRSLVSLVIQLLSKT